jgi:hypothetical protein
VCCEENPLPKADMLTQLALVLTLLRFLEPPLRLTL